MSTNDTRVSEAIRILKGGEQRQDSLTDQLDDVLDLGRAAGCYDALDYIREAIGRLPADSRRS